MLAGEGNFAQTVLQLLFVVNVGGGDGRHANNGVHWRAYIVAHAGEKITFGFVGVLSFTLRPHKLLHLGFVNIIVANEQHQQAD